MSRIKVIGIGSAMRRDDGIGIRLVNALKVDDVECAECPCDLSILHALENCDAAVIADAVDFGGKPGETRVMKPGDLPRNGGETHSMNLGRILDLADLGGERPEILIFGVQPADVGFGDSLSEEMSRAMPSVERALETLVRNLAR